jgi:hypothetical protein
MSLPASRRLPPLPDPVALDPAVVDEYLPGHRAWVRGRGELLLFGDDPDEAWGYPPSDTPPAAARRRANAARFSRQLAHAGIPHEAAGVAFLLPCGKAADADRLGRFCELNGVWLPVVPHPGGGAALRAVVSADHRPADLDLCVCILAAGLAELTAAAPHLASGWS